MSTSGSSTTFFPLKFIQHPVHVSGESSFLYVLQVLSELLPKEWESLSHRSCHFCWAWEYPENHVWKYNLIIGDENVQVQQRRPAYWWEF